MKHLIQQQVDLTANLVSVYSENPLLNVHFLLMMYIQEKEFYKTLSEKLNGELTIDHFASIFAEVLENYVDNFGSN